MVEMDKLDDLELCLGENLTIRSVNETTILHIVISRTVSQASQSKSYDLCCLSALFNDSVVRESVPQTTSIRKTPSLTSSMGPSIRSLLINFAIHVLLRPRDHSVSR